MSQAGSVMGQRFGAYQVLEEAGPLHGTGLQSAGPGNASLAGAKVFLAVDPRTEARVALRVYPAQVAADPGQLRSLRESLRAVARLQHPNIPAVLGSGMHAGLPFVVFPFTAAGSLQDRLASRLTRTLDRAELASQLAAALSHAHAHGLLHGNLKPTKVLFDESGIAQVIGLGEAQALAEGTAPRAQDTHPRSPYQAPEAHRSGLLTPAADQYSLGMLLLELFTEAPAEEAQARLRTEVEMQTTEAARTGPRPETLPRAFRDVLVRATAADPRDRYASVQDMHRALRIALGLEPPPQPATPRPLPPPAGARRRKARLRVAWAALMLAGLCAVFTVPAFSARWEGRQLRDLPAFLLGEDVHPLATDGRQAASLGSEDLTTPPTAGVVVDLSATAPGSQPSGSASFPTSTAPAGGEGAQSAPPTQPPATSQPTATEAPATPTPETTVVPDATDTPEPTGTPLPAPTTEPTKKPGKCKDDPSHPNYCTPTP